MAAPAIVDTSAYEQGAEGLITVFTLVEHPEADRPYRRALFPSLSDYKTAIAISNVLQRKGMGVGAIDILIASMALNRNLAVITKDRDFEKIQAVERKLKIEWVQ
ncbi:PIN domain-containing protein [Candidatus Micrarchaeota archaeon]|nr:PIN domain-containing protein [Candidatus Micrarchaeota archaeon]